MGRRSPMGGRRFGAVGAALAVLVAVGAAAAQSPAALHQWARTASASTEYGSGTQWAAMSAAGEPDVTEYGDNQLAWTPKAKDGTTDWLDLRYDQAVIPTGIDIHESFSPGFVTKVEAYHTADAAWVTLWEGTDPTPTGALGIFSPSLESTDVAVDRIRVTIDTRHPGLQRDRRRGAGRDAAGRLGSPDRQWRPRSRRVPNPRRCPRYGVADPRSRPLRRRPTSRCRSPPMSSRRPATPSWRPSGSGSAWPSSTRSCRTSSPTLQQRGAADLADYLAQQPPLELPGASSDRTGLVASIAGLPPRRRSESSPTRVGRSSPVLVGMLFTGADMARKMPIGPDAATSDSTPFDKQGTERVGSRDVPYSMHAEDHFGSDHGRISQSTTQQETYNIPDKVTGELKATIQDGTTVSFEMGVCPDQIGALTGRVTVSSERVFDSVSGPGVSTARTRAATTSWCR